MINVISWLILGLVAGWLAKKIMPGKDPGGFFVTIAIGVIGAFIGGFIGKHTGVLGQATGFNFGSLITAIIGALVLLGIIRVLSKKY